MKKITVYQEGVEKIELIDEEDGDIEGFSRALSNVLKGSTVSIINTTGTALIIRPSRVISILIKDEPKASKVTSKEKKKAQKPKEKVDIITDVN